MMDFDAIQQSNFSSRSTVPGTCTFYFHYHWINFHFFKSIFFTTLSSHRQHAFIGAAANYDCSSLVIQGSRFYRTRRRSVLKELGPSVVVCLVLRVLFVYLIQEPIELLPPVLLSSILNINHEIIASFLCPDALQLSTSWTSAPVASSVSGKKSPSNS